MTDKIKKTKVKPVGRPTLYTEELGIKICEAIAQGQSLVSICKPENMPCVGSVYYWLRDDNLKDFLNTYTRAREDQADTLADEIIGIADDGSNDTYIDEKTGERKEITDVIGRSKLRVEARKWVAAKLKPKKYGDRQVVENTGANGGPIKIESNVTLSPDEAYKRLLENND